MQKKFIALAVAGLVSGAAFAQSNVTIYGVADATFDNISASNQTAGATNYANSNRVSTNSSHIGFKGSEALGNGLTAVFQYEIGVGFDSAATLATSRDSYVGVAGGFGTVVLGTLTGPTRALGAALDVNAGATGIGANAGIIGKLGGFLTNVTTDGTTGSVPAGPAPIAAARSSTQTSTFDTRWKNAIAYVSPTFSGFSGVAAYVANENHSDSVNTSGYDLGLNYKNGPWFAGLSYNRVDVRNNTATLGLGTDIKVADTRLGGSYDFGNASIRLMWDHVTGKSSAIDIKQNTWGLGGTFNATANGKIIAQYYKAGDISELAGDQGARLWEIGYEHSLSKRTMLKAAYANLSNDKNAAYDFGVNASGAATLNNATISGFQVGVRHAF